MPQFDPLIFSSLMYYAIISFVVVYGILLRLSFSNFITSLKYKEKRFFFFRLISKNWNLVINLFNFKFER